MKNDLTLVKDFIDDLFVDITVKQMLNPDNKSFYIGTLTLAQCRELLHDADEGLTHAFWKAFGIAQGIYLEQMHIDKELDHFEDACPECGCTSYVEGCACPNCDYVEEV